jgi:hypothetical protein
MAANGPHEHPAITFDARQQRPLGDGRPHCD